MIKTAQTSVFPKINPHQVTSYPQQATSIPAVSPAEGGFDPSVLTAIIGPMITLIMVVMMMSMMTKMMDKMAV